MSRLAFLAGAAAVGLSAAAGPLVHLRLDEGSGTVAHDASGNGLDAKLVDCAWERFGQQGGAVRLNGKSSYIEFPKDPRIQDLRDEATYSCWMKIGSPGRASVFSRGGWGDGWTCYICPSHIALNGRLEGVKDGASALCLRTIPSGTDALQPYVHFALTFRRHRDDPNRTTIVFYLNGKQTAGRQGETEYAQKGRIKEGIKHPLTVGKYVAYESQWFGGLIDEVKVFDRALTSEEIAADYAVDKARKAAAAVKAVKLGKVDLKPLKRTRLAVIDIGRADGGWKTEPVMPVEWFRAEAEKCGCAVRVLSAAEAADAKVLNAKAFDTVVLPTVAMPFECEYSLFAFLEGGGTLICRSVLPWTYKEGEKGWKEHSYGWYAPFLVRANPTPEAHRPFVDPLAIDPGAAEAVGDLLPAVIEPVKNMYYRPLDRWRKVRTFDGGYGDTANYSLAADCMFCPYSEPNGVGTDFAFYRYFNARLFGSTLVQIGDVGRLLLKGAKGPDAFKAILHLAESRFPREHGASYGRAAVRVQKDWSELGFAYMDAVSALRDAAAYAYDTAGDAKAHIDALGAVERRFAELEGLRREQRKLLLADEDEAATVAVTKRLLPGIAAAAGEFRAAAEGARRSTAGARHPAWKPVRHRYGTIPSIASSTMPITLARARGPLFETIRRIGSNVTSDPLLNWYVGDPAVRARLDGFWRDFKFVYDACPVFSIGGDRLNPANGTVKPSKDLSYNLDGIRRKLEAQVGRFAWMGTNRLFRIGTGDETGLGCGFWGKTARDYFVKWLEARYGTVGEMNAKCGTDVASFDALALPVRQPRTQPEHALWELWRRCREHKLREHQQAFYRVVKEVAPTLDTFNIPSAGAFSSPLFGLNVYETFCDTDMSGVDGTCVLDKYEWQYADLCPQKRFLTSEWGGLYTDKPMQYLYGKLWQEMAAGSWGAEQHIWSFGEDSCNYADFLDIPTLNGAMLWAWLRDARRYDPLFLDGTRADPEIGILYSQTSRCHDQPWGFEGERRDSAHMDAVTGLYRIFLDYGRSARVVDELELLRGDVRIPPVLFVAEARYLATGVQNRLRQYAAGGGLLAVVGRSGEFDRFGRPSGLLGKPQLAKVTPEGVEGFLRSHGLSPRFAVSDQERMLREWIYDGDTYLVLASRCGAVGKDWGIGEVEVAVRGRVQIEDALTGAKPKARQEDGYTVFKTLAVNGARVFRVVSGKIAPADDKEALSRRPCFEGGRDVAAAGDLRDVALPFDEKLYDATAIRAGGAVFSLTTVGSGDRPGSGESYLSLTEGGETVRRKLVEKQSFEMKTAKGRTFKVLCRRNFQMFPFYSEVRIEERK